jgi:hypothetical protein
MGADVDKSTSNVLKMQLNGRYSFRASFRYVGKERERRTFGLLFGETKDTAWALLFTWAETVDLVRFDGGSDRIQSKVLSDHDWSKWATLRVAVDGNEVSAFLNGEMLFRYTADGDKVFDGAPGVMVERCHAEVRDVEVQR